MESNIINTLRTLNQELSKHILQGNTDFVLKECVKRLSCENGIDNVFDILYWISYMEWKHSISSNILVETTIDQMDDMIKEAIPTKIDDIKKMKNIRVCLASVAIYLVDSGKLIKDIDDNLYTPPLAL